MSGSRFSKMSKQLTALKKNYQNMPKERRQKMIAGIILAFIFMFFLCAYISGNTIGTIIQMLRPNEKKYGVLYYALAEPVGLLLTIVIYVLILILFSTILFQKNIINSEKYTTADGLVVAEKSTHGSGREMLREEIDDVYKVADITDTKDIVYGQITTDGTETVSFKSEKFPADSNKNLLLIGSPGTGKSFCFVRTNILQAMLRGDSIVATDPSGELYTSLGETLRNNGYDVRVLNLAEPRFSDFWNCMEECIDPETKRLDGTRLNDFTYIYAKNADIGDSFWTKGTTNLLRAVIGHVSWKRECDILSHYKELYAKVAKPGMEKDNVLDNQMKDMIPFSWCEEVIMDAALKNGFEKEDILKSFKSIWDSAPPFTIREVYNDVMNLNAIIPDFETIPISHPAKQAFVIFSSAKDQVQSSVINSTQLSMQLFADDKLAAVLSHDGISIQNINMKKCAYFVAMSDKSDTTKPIASLFFSFFFKDVQENWDKYSKIAEEDGIPNPCLDTFVMLDEFFSIGTIGGDENAFAKTVSVNRKRHMAVNIVIQSITQLPALYGDNNATNIQNCCEYILFLGCNDPETAEFVSSFIAGEGTILTESHKETTNAFSASNDNTVTVKAEKRKVLSLEEVRRWKDKVLLCKRGEYYIGLERFPWKLHPCYVNGETKPLSVYKTIVPIEKRVMELEQNKGEDAYKETSNQIQQIKSKYSKNIPKKDSFEQQSLNVETNESKKENKKMSDTERLLG